MKKSLRFKISLIILACSDFNTKSNMAYYKIKYPTTIKSDKDNSKIKLGKGSIVLRSVQPKGSTFVSKSPDLYEIKGFIKKKYGVVFESKNINGSYQSSFIYKGKFYSSELHNTKSLSETEAIYKLLNSL